MKNASKQVPAVESLLITQARAEVMLHESFRTSMLMIFAGNTLIPQLILSVVRFCLLEPELSCSCRPGSAWLFNHSKSAGFKGRETCHLRHSSDTQLHHYWFSFSSFIWSEFELLLYLVWWWPNYTVQWNLITQAEVRSGEIFLCELAGSKH